MKEYAAKVPKPRVQVDDSMYARGFRGSMQDMVTTNSSSAGSRKASLTHDLETLQSQHERDMADVHAIKRQLDLL